jgi:GGDEF domain-containing protein
MTDALTGLLNRVAFEIFAARDLLLAQRSGGRMAILVAEPNLVGCP